VNPVAEPNDPERRPPLRRLLLLAVLFTSVPFLVPRRPARVLDARTSPYYEDAAVQRPVASVLAELVEDVGSLRLRVTVSAIGDEVEPLPGLEGVHGVNLRTAEELDRLLRGDTLRLVLRHSGALVPGTLESVQRDHLPARRIGPDGRLRLEERTEASWPVRAVFFGPPLPEGKSWTYLEADGVPRLAIAVESNAWRCRIAHIESRGEDRGGMAAAMEAPR
jgi:hypothetical protein